MKAKRLKLHCWGRGWRVHDPPFVIQLDNLSEKYEKARFSSKESNRTGKNKTFESLEKMEMLSVGTGFYHPDLTG